ncbi:hypothetical protein [uncultured Polaribacter sp.]|uniref:hypothetical protein n=1 Tax=uncultured Polaribacter sp. TaxID=174711 RepID=UPI0026060B9D|nr:hypothetical protein [uncultured Polaribacter sp.]
MFQLVKQTIINIQENKFLSLDEIEKAKCCFSEYNHIILSQGNEKITTLIENEEEFTVEIVSEDATNLFARINGQIVEWDFTSLIALYLIDSIKDKEILSEGVIYQRRYAKESAARALR